MSVIFVADLNKNPNLVNLKVVSSGDCWALAEVCTVLSASLVVPVV